MGKSVLYALLAASIFVFGFTIGRFTDVVDAGGETFKKGKMMPDISQLDDKGQQVAKALIANAAELGKTASENVKTIFESAPDKADEQFEKMMERVEKDPTYLAMMTRKIPKRPPPEDPNKVFDVDTGNVPVLGPEDAPITIVEFSDFQCPFCSRGTNTVKQLMDEYPGKIKVKFVTKWLPFHKNAPAAHVAAYAAWKQGKFWEFHDLAFANQKDLTEENFEKWAKEIGLDMAQFKADNDMEKFKDEFDRMDKLANDVGVQGTPTFLINGKKLRGAQPPAKFKEIIDKELAAG
ncbi:MAG: thioredoxin domain-containing protein [Deltaproteobacteria bacterium]|nr:thioredoxin domain-containing protein [bacterium]MCB9476497.1 thioredoxin domain-containing protein [Deltaproteobacteria bacterium]MCB9478918.1 thioredoxin domain-containing protein [Deltaproteobacteria bacterium]MCB9489424.1 thioredoxin domain-containing protein [Deltaproteobacteria bacterium]